MKMLENLQYKGIGREESGRETGRNVGKTESERKGERVGEKEIVGIYI